LKRRTVRGMVVKQNFSERLSKKHYRIHRFNNKKRTWQPSGGRATARWQNFCGNGGTRIKNPGCIYQSILRSTLTCWNVVVFAMSTARRANTMRDVRGLLSNHFSSSHWRTSLHRGILRFSTIHYALERVAVCLSDSAFQIKRHH